MRRKLGPGRGVLMVVLLASVRALAQDVNVLRPLKLSTLIGRTGTYSWRPTGRSGMRPLQAEIRKSVDVELAGKGWQVVAAGGDFTLSATDEDKTILTTRRPVIGPAAALNYDGVRPSATWGSQRGYASSQNAGALDFGPATSLVETARLRVVTLQVYDGLGKKKLSKAQVLDPRRDRDSLVANAQSDIGAILQPFPTVRRVAAK